MMSGGTPLDALLEQALCGTSGIVSDDPRPDLPQGENDVIRRSYL
jgi:hypothetical protein